MRQTIQFIFALAGALVGVFYIGSMASDSFIASRSFDNPDDVMLQHSLIYLITIGGCLLAGWLVGRIFAIIFCRD